MKELEQVIVQNKIFQNDFFDENFFVIDSKRLIEVKPKLYGYAFDDKKLYINTKRCNHVLPSDAIGSFVNVVVRGKSIDIYQDYFGCYGIYLYRRGDNYILSNSFFYLLDYLKDKYRLTFDEDFALAFMAHPIHVFSYRETFTKEIIMLPRNSVVHIDKENGEMKISYIHQKEYYIPIDTPEAIDILDGWHKKWSNIIRGIQQRGECLSLGLSGGKDSRVTFSCCLGSGVELDKIYMKSTKDEIYTHKDDYEIAEEIGRVYGFSLNKGRVPERFCIDPLDNLISSLMVKGGFHKEIMVTRFYNQKTNYMLAGVGGESIRGYWPDSTEGFIRKQVQGERSICKDALEGLMRRTKSQIDDMAEKMGFNVEDVARNYFWKEAANRHHAGKGNVELFLANTIVLSPLMDPALLRLNQCIGKDNDLDLIYQLIYERYLPDILNLRFDSNHVIKEETKAVAHAINEKYPLTDVNEVVSSTLEIIDDRQMLPKKAKKKGEPLDFLKAMFFVEETHKFITQHYNENIYLYGVECYKRSYHPHIMPCGVVQVFYIWSLVQLNHYLLEEKTFTSGKRNFKETEHEQISFYDVLKKLIQENTLGKLPTSDTYWNTGLYNKIFNMLCSCRVDIKNFGREGNSIEWETEASVFNEKPQWFKDKDGVGQVFQVSGRYFKLSVRCCGAGKLRIDIKAPWLLGVNRKTLPLMIDLQSVYLETTDGKIVYSGVRLNAIDHEHPCRIERECYDGEEFVLKIQWLPHMYGEENLQELLHEMLKVSVTTYRFWEGN